MFKKRKKDDVPQEGVDPQAEQGQGAGDEEIIITTDPAAQAPTGGTAQAVGGDGQPVTGPAQADPAEVPEGVNQVKYSWREDRLEAIRPALADAGLTDLPAEPSDVWLEQSLQHLRSGGYRQLAGQLRGAVKKETSHAASAIGREAQLRSLDSVEKQKRKQERGIVLDERGQPVAKKFPVVPMAVALGVSLLLGGMGWAILANSQKEAEADKAAAEAQLAQQNQKDPLNEIALETEETVPATPLTGDGSVAAAPGSTPAASGAATTAPDGTPTSDLDQQEAYSNGYAEGQQAGSQASYDQGFSEGQQAGRAQGQQEGQSQGQEAGYAQGQEAGYSQGVQEGQEAGYAQGVQEGQQAGVQAGRDAGVQEGIAQGREEGRAAGVQEGRQAGYQEGLVAGRAQAPAVVTPVTIAPPARGSSTQTTPVTVAPTTKVAPSIAPTAKPVTTTVNTPPPLGRLSLSGTANRATGSGGTQEGGSTASASRRGSLSVTGTPASSASPGRRLSLTGSPSASTASGGGYRGQLTLNNGSSGSGATQTAAQPAVSAGAEPVATPTTQAQQGGQLVLTSSSAATSRTTVGGSGITAMTASQGIGQSVGSPRFGPYRPYQRIRAQLTTAIVVGEGLPNLPVIARSEDGREWVGTPVTGASGRVTMSFTELVVADRGEVTPITASAYDLYGVPGLQGKTQDLSPDLLRNMVRSAATGVRDYADAQLNATETVILPNGTVVTNKKGGDLWTAVGARALDVLSLPPNTPTFTRTVTLPKGTQFIIVVGAGAAQQQ